MPEPLKDRCLGRWTGILPQLGIAASALTGRHGPCPMCGGRDRFRFDNREGRGTWICNQCGAGDGIALAMALNGWTFRRAAEEIERIVGTVPTGDAVAAQSPDTRQALNRLWASSAPSALGDPVDLYLRHRLGDAAVPACLRTAARVRYQDGEGAPSWHPAMIAMVQGPDGRPASLHRTYLTIDGNKAGVPSPRKMMPGPIPKGSAVRLAPAGEVLGIAEGIETALAAVRLFGVPVWAAINAGNMRAWRPPTEATKVIVFADNDATFTGQAAAFSLAQAISSGGVQAEVRCPDDVGTDWADVLQRQAASAFALLKQAVGEGA